MSTLKKGLIICILSLIYINAAADTTQVYTWTDAKGVVYYSETPPKDKEQQSVLVTTKTSQNSDAESSDAGTSTAETQTSSTGTEGTQVISKDANACKQATEARKSLIGTPILRRNGKVMTIEEKNEELRNMEEIIKIHC